MNEWMDELVSENGTEGVLWTRTNKNSIKGETQRARYKDVTKDGGETLEDTEGEKHNSVYFWAMDGNQSKTKIYYWQEPV